MPQGVEPLQTLHSRLLINGHSGVIFPSIIGFLATRHIASSGNWTRKSSVSSGAGNVPNAGLLGGAKQGVREPRGPGWSMQVLDSSCR